MKEEKAVHLEAGRKMGRILRYYSAATPLKNFRRDQVAKMDVRIGQLGGKPAKRLVIHLRSNGCGWKRSGGCTMCGFWAETAQQKDKISVEDFVHQFEGVLKRFDIREYPIVCIYNAGSILNEQEIPIEALERIVKMISAVPEIAQVVFESRIDYFNSQKLSRLKGILKDKDLLIGVGLESANDIVRDLCIHKGLDKRVFERKLELAKSIGIKPVVYVLIKPLFLTEAEAIDDAVATTGYLCDLGIQNIHYETMTIENHTLAHALFGLGQYQLPWLWTIIEIIERVSSRARPFVSPFSYITQAEAVPHNCPSCTPQVTKAILEDYCSSFDLTRLRNLNCACKSQWLRELEKGSELNIEQRVLKTLADLSNELGIQDEPDPNNRTGQ